MTKIYRRQIVTSTSLARVFPPCDRCERHSRQSLTMGGVVTPVCLFISALVLQLFVPANTVASLQESTAGQTATTETANANGLEDEARALKTGKAFRKTLEAPCSIEWNPTLLRRGIGNLSKAYGIAIFLDRRVDPGKNVRASYEDKTLGFVLYSLAKQLNLEVCFEADVAYIGPRDAIDRLTTLIAWNKRSLAKIPSEQRFKMLQPAVLHWPRLTDPRSLIERVCARGGFENIDVTVIPHDLWNAGMLPAGTLEEQLAILLCGFDMTCMFADDGKRISLINVPDDALPVIDYRIPQKLIDDVRITQKQRTLAKFDRRTGKLTLKADFQTHAGIYRLLNPPPAADSTAGAEGEQVYSLEITAQAGSVLASIAKMLDCDIRYEDSVRSRLTESVSISAMNAKVEELLRQALEPLQLDYIRDGRDLVIIQKESR